MKITLLIDDKPRDFYDTPPVVPVEPPVVTPPVELPPVVPPASGMPTLADEKALRAKLGWQDRPFAFLDPVPPNLYSLGDNVDIHGVTEGDLLWTYYWLWKRTGAAKNRMDAALDYFKNRYRTGASFAEDLTHDLCHAYGWGLMDVYEQEGDRDALAEAKNIGGVVITKLGRFGLYYGLRGAGRQLQLITRLSEKDPVRFASVRDQMINAVLTSDYWDARGTYWMGDQATTDQYLSWKPNAYASGMRLQSSFMTGVLVEGLWQAYRVTKRADVRARLLAIAQFMLANGLDEATKLTGQYFYLDGGKIIHGVDPNDNAYCNSLVNTLVIGYKLTGDQRFLDRAMLHFKRSNQDQHYIDTQFDPSGYFPGHNFGELQYNYLLLENGGSPTVESSVPPVITPPVVPPVVIPPVEPPKPTPSGTPKWAQGQQVGEWRPVSAWKPSDIGIRLIGPWCGMWADRKRARIGQDGPGGHKDEWQFFSWMLDLLQDDPRGELLYVGPGFDQVIADAPDGRYKDGSYSPSHYYDGQHWSDSLQRVVTAGTGPLYGDSGRGFPYFRAFDPVTRKHDPIGTLPDVPLPTYPDSATAYDPRNGYIWMWHDTQLALWHQETRSWSTHNLARSQAGGQACIDTKRNRMVYFGAKPCYMDFNTWQFTDLQLASFAQQGYGVQYIDAIDKFLLRGPRDSGGRVVSVSAESLNSYDLFTAPGDVSGATIPAPEGPTAGIYSRFNQVEINGMTFCTLAPAANERIWALRVT